MPNPRESSADVSGLHAVNTAPDNGRSEGHMTDQLHASRARELLLGNILGTAVAIGGVYAARQLTPNLVASAEKQVAGWIEQRGKGLDGAHSLEEAARKSVNTALMMTSGLCSSIGSQTLLARRRRDAHDVQQDVSVTRDVTRLLTGWSFGSFGAAGAYYLAERYTHAPMLQVEKFLDKALKGFEYAPENRLSESLVANAVMTVGAIPVNVIGQRLYDAVISHPAYEKQR